MATKRTSGIIRLRIGQFWRSLSGSQGLILQRIVQQISNSPWTGAYASESRRDNVPRSEKPSKGQT